MCSHLSTEKDYNRCLQMFISAGTNVNAQCMNCCTALMEAALEEHGRCIRTLIHAGAEVNTQTQEGETALMYTAPNASAHSVQKHTVIRS